MQQVANVEDLVKKKKTYNKHDFAADGATNVLSRKEAISQSPTGVNIGVTNQWRGMKMPLVLGVYLKRCSNICQHSHIDPPVFRKERFCLLPLAGMSGQTPKIGGKNHITKFPTGKLKQKKFSDL